MEIMGGNSNRRFIDKNVFQLLYYSSTPKIVSCQGYWKEIFAGKIQLPALSRVPIYARRDVFHLRVK